MQHAQIAQALKAAGPNSRVMIEKQRRCLYVCLQLVNLPVQDLTYHDVRPQDDMASYSDHQEIDRTDA